MGDMGVRFAAVLNAGVRAEGWLVAVLVAVVVSVVITVLVAAMLLACAPVVSHWLSSRRGGVRHVKSTVGGRVAPERRLRARTPAIPAPARGLGFWLAPVLSGVAMVLLVVVGVALMSDDAQNTRVQAAGGGPSVGPAPASSTTTVPRPAPRRVVVPRRTSPTTTSTVETIPPPFIPDADDALRLRRSTRPRATYVRPPTIPRRPPTTMRPSPTTTRPTPTTRPTTATTVRSSLG